MRLYYSQLKLRSEYASVQCRAFPRVASTNLSESGRHLKDPCRVVDTALIKTLI
jgi:hypothetical protein